MLVELMVAAFAIGVAAAILLPLGGVMRWVALAAAAVGSTAAVMLGVTVLREGATWTGRWDNLLQPLGGVSLRIDSLAAFFLVIVGITGVPASLYGIGYLRHLDGRLRARASHALLNVFIASMCLVACADNVATFLFAWEVMALSSYLLVVGDPEQQDASTAGLWYAVMTHAGFFALLAGFILLGQGGSWEFPVLRTTATTLAPGTRGAVFLLMAAAFGSKAGLVPLHVWLPRAHPAAPSHVSALMSAAMVNLGVYGMARLVFDLLPPGPPWWGGVLLTAGVITALTGVLYSVAETHLKRLLAYSTIENLGLVFIGLGFAILMRGYGYGPLASMGLVAALLHTLNHAVFKSLLFLAAGSVVHGTHSVSMEAFGGLIKRMPITAVLSLVGALALAGLPPLNGFPSEWLTFQLLVAGAQHTAPALAILLPLALAGVALVAGLAAVSGVRLFGITFLALPRSEGARDAHECSRIMIAAMLLPTAGCLALGVGPTIVIPQLSRIVSDLGQPAGSLSAGLALSVPLVSSRMWGAAIALLVVGVGLVAAAAVRLTGRARTVRIGAAWNCGRIVQSARSEYTAAAFAEPLKRIFTGFYRPTQEVTVDVHPASRYFVRAIRLRADLAPWMEQMFYEPVLRATRAVSNRMGQLHSGSIHFYLALLPGALLMLLLIARWIR
jgi:formate hydrogenlyase subunit 3/multisubunit Na+/H+ antiporter MnhD subunit